MVEHENGKVQRALPFLCRNVWLMLHRFVGAYRPSLLPRTQLSQVGLLPLTALDALTDLLRPAILRSLV